MKKKKDLNFPKELLISPWVKVECDEYYEINKLGILRYKVYYKNGTTKYKYKKGSAHNDKYKILKLLKNGIRVTFYVHKLIALAFIKNPDPLHKTQVNHIDGNKQNNSLENLEWVTPSENIQHAIKTGLLNLDYLKNNYKGEDNPNHKLLEKDIIKIRLLFESGLNGKQVQKYYTNITTSHLYNIRNKKYW